MRRVVMEVLGALVRVAEWIDDAYQRQKSSILSRFRPCQLCQCPAGEGLCKSCGWCRRCCKMFAIDADCEQILQSEEATDA